MLAGLFFMCSSCRKHKKVVIMERIKGKVANKLLELQFRV